MKDLMLGIDTGGTYTDGVLLEETTRQVVATTKQLTTHHDLKIGVLRALDDLLPDDLSRVKLVAVSTTLATNTIAEGKGRPVALFLLGYDPELVKHFKFERDFATERYFYVRGGHTLEALEQAPLDTQDLLKKGRSVQDEVEALAISGYFSPFNNEHEELAAAELTQTTGLPAVLGHQLSGKLNSIQRATTATLNASLLSVLREFIEAMQVAMEERGLDAPLMVVRGDGALMNAAGIGLRPVETVHSGPAASAIGGRFLSGQENALVIDIGGTTTDIALVDGGQVTVSEEGTTVGAYNTAVRAAHIRSIGLGGDSAITFDLEDQLAIGPARVTPIAYLAHHDPRVAADLRLLPGRLSKRPTAEHAEYWYLLREPRRPVRSDRAREALGLLRERPYALPQLLERLGVYHPIQFDGLSLVRAGVLARAALTPTDLLHLSGEYAPWDIESAQRAAGLVARLRGWSVEELDSRARGYIAERIAAEVVTFISGQTLERQPGYLPVDDLGVWLFEENLYGRNPYLGARLRLKVPIIGIGAPAGIFLPRVAELLHTDLILPPHFEVANAVGAVAGSVIAVEEAWILPQSRGLNVVGFYVQTSQIRRRFSRLDEALAFARKALGAQALENARSAGAVDPQVSFEQLPDGAESYRLRARAIGNPQLGE